MPLHAINYLFISNQPHTFGSRSPSDGVICSRPRWPPIPAVPPQSQTPAARGLAWRSPARHLSSPAHALSSGGQPVWKTNQDFDNIIQEVCEL